MSDRMSERCCLAILVSDLAISNLSSKFEIGESRINIYGKI